MKHVVFALFKDQQAAEAAIECIIEADPAHGEHISLIVHRGAMSGAAFDESVQHSDLDETDAAHGFVLGAWLGAATGAVVGALLAGPFGLFGAGPLIGTLWGAGTGSVCGMLGAGLAGAGLTDRSLEKLARRIEAGDVLITIQTPDKSTENRVEALLRDLGAEIAEKRVLT